MTGKELLDVIGNGKLGNFSESIRSLKESLKTAFESIEQHSNITWDNMHEIDVKLEDESLPEEELDRLDDESMKLYDEYNKELDQCASITNFINCLNCIDECIDDIEYWFDIGVDERIHYF